MKFILERLKEKSTWAGIVAVLVAFGLVDLDAEKAQAIASVGAAVIGLILVFMKDRKTEPGGEFNPDAEVRKATRARTNFPKRK